MMETRTRNGRSLVGEYGETGLPTPPRRARWKRLIPCPEQTFTLLAHGVTIYFLWRVVEALRDLISVLAHHSAR